MQTITPLEMARLLRTRPVELIDVRPKKDFKRGHAAGARSIPWPGFEPHAVLAHRRLNEHAPLYLMAKGKMRATLAAGCLAGAGLESPVVVEGNWEEWVREHLPVAPASGRRMIAPVLRKLEAEGHAFLAGAARLCSLTRAHWQSVRSEKPSA